MISPNQILSEHREPKNKISKHQSVFDAVSRVFRRPSSPQGL